MHYFSLCLIKSILNKAPLLRCPHAGGPARRLPRGPLTAGPGHRHTDAAPWTGSNPACAPQDTRKRRSPLDLRRGTHRYAIHDAQHYDDAALEKAEPAMPVEDRAADTWEPLIAVADHAGGHWPERARAAVLALTAEADDNGETSTRIRLLADCRTAFGTDLALPTATLLERLKTDPEAGWADYGPAGLTAMKLGVILREYDIRSTTIRFPNGQAKGYLLADFADAWARYCPLPKATDDTSEPFEDASDGGENGAVVPFERGSRTSRTSLNIAGQTRYGLPPGTAQAVPAHDLGTA
ncbi:DUF3631 domain-containing protein [Streptosporangium canum]|uniref:DUF3631 domain-containing protein n=1 Tax=Streptosporangium canum TaxID=324952 RepID=UPI0034343DF9